MRWLPKGTHEWNKFITPDELFGMLETAGLTPVDRKGFVFNPLGWSWSISDRDLSVNYVTASTKRSSELEFAATLGMHIAPTFVGALLCLSSSTQSGNCVDKHKDDRGNHGKKVQPFFALHASSSNLTRNSRSTGSTPLTRCSPSSPTTSLSNGAIAANAASLAC